VLRSELTKQLTRARAWVTLGVMAVVPAVVAAVIALSSPGLAERFGDYGSVVSNSSGLTLPLIVTSAMLLFFLPLAVAIFAGESVAGEASWGSLRYVLARPVSRARLLACKLVVAAGLTIAAVLITAIAAGVCGTIAFGWHPLTVVDLQYTTAFYVASATFSPLGAVAQLLLALAYVLATLTSTFAFSLLLSTMTSRPFSAVAGGVGFGLFSRALDNIPGLHALSAWLPMTDSGTSLWSGFFARPEQFAGVGHALAVQAGYTAIFLAAAFYWFSRSDILT
jgi:ABC-2 type transport system permease protein